MNKKNISEIHPLSFMQQSLLMHHLHEKEDQGLIQVKCKLYGNLNENLFYKSWNEVFKNHASLRTSIHWENISKPVQVVHRDFIIPFEVIDLTKLDDRQKSVKIEEIIQADRTNKLDLTKTPLSRVTLIYFGKEEYFLIWTCHHILVDGWSSAIALKEVMTYYESFVLNIKHEKATAPSFFDYLKWVSKQPLDTAESFWKNNLSGFEDTNLIESGKRSQKSVAHFKNANLAIDGKRSELIVQFAKDRKVSLNVFYEGVWSILLCHVMSKEDIVFGLTTSGRSIANNMNVEGIIGMLMNVLPLRVNFPKNINDLFTSIQQKQTNILQYEFLSLSQILHFKNWSLNISLFDTLFIFENFPNYELSGGGILLKDFESDVTTTYPLAVIIKPQEQVQVTIKYDSNVINQKLINSFLDNFSKVINLILFEDNLSLTDLKSQLNFPKDAINSIHSHRESISKQTDLERMRYSRNIEGANISKLVKREGNIANYESPTNSLELSLSQIWEDLFGWYPIGINDDFFEIGGTSMMAIQLFAQIEKHIGCNLPPTVLLSNPNIKQLSQLIRKDKKHSWTTLVPLRQNGTRHPLFCLHAGGAHVLFYHDLAKHLSEDQPVYAIQPIGLDGLEKAHETIEEMAAYYIAEIQKVQPAGPYAMLGTCFSDALGIEMAIQLTKKGHIVDPLIIVDSTPMGIEPDNMTRKEKIQGYFEILRKRNYSLIYHLIKAKFKSIVDSRPKPEKLDHLTDLDKNQLSNLATIRKRLFDLYEKYQWKPYQGKVTYIQSNEYYDRPWVRKLVSTWTKIAKGGVETYTVPGKHYSLFEEPEVQGLARQVDECMQKSNLRKEWNSTD